MRRIVSRLSLILIILLMHGRYVMNERINRLIMPTTSSKLRVIPRVDLPFTMTTSVASGLSMKLPITMTFPSMLDLLMPVRLAMAANQMSPQAVAGARPGVGAQMVGAASTTGASTGSRSFTYRNVSRVLMRKKTYQAIESLHPEWGKPCLLRAICEVAQTPYMAPSTGLFGQIVDMLLR